MSQKTGRCHRIYNKLWRKGFEKIQKLPKLLRSAAYKGLSLSNKTGISNLIPLPYARNKVDKLMHLVPYDWMRFLPALPFMFMELLVGFIQALVFTLLSAVFLKLICEHDDHGDEEHAH